MPDKESINLYGDKIVATTGSHGADIASQRIDDLDRSCLEFALSQNAGESFAIDIGSGLGLQGIRLSLLGIETLLVDILDISPTIRVISETLGISNIALLTKDAKHIKDVDIYRDANIVFSQRFIHYLRYNKAKVLMSVVSKGMVKGGRLYISASGLHSELGNGYPHKNRKINERHSTLASSMAEKHHIREPVCLYSEDDMKNLVVPTGFSAVRVWSSQFGNIKAIFEKQ